MRISSFITFVGFVLIIAGCYCPLLRPFHLFNYNMFGLSQPYGIVILLVSVIGILGVALKQRALARTAAIISTLLIVLIFAAAIFKVNTSFSFLPFKGLATALSHAIKYKYGWYVLFGGAVLAIGGAFADKPVKHKMKETAV
jgi:presenilin-like A22 family membrane protease